MSKRSAKLSGAVLLLGASFVQAQDAKILPGTICQPRNGNPNYLSGSLVNASTTSSMAAICPLVRDNTTATNPILSSASVWIVNRGPLPSSLSCTLCAYFTNSNSSQCQSVTSNVITVTPQQLTFPSLSVPSGTGHSLEVECQLPPAQAPGASSVRNLAWSDP